MRDTIIGLATAAVVMGGLAPSLMAAPKDEPVVSLLEVRDMQRLVPDCERGCTSIGGAARSGDSMRVASAVSVVARNRVEAAEMLVYAYLESANRLRAVGDRGKSLGAWQLGGVEERVAFDPIMAARYWIAASDASRSLCAGLPAEERLAALVSGSCDHGREKAAHRHEVAEAMSR